MNQGIKQNLMEVVESPEQVKKNKLFPPPAEKFLKLSSDTLSSFANGNHEVA